MYRYTHLIIVALLAMMFTTVPGCSKDVVYSSGSLSNVALSSQVDESLLPIKPATSFLDDVQKIYCSFTPSNVPIGDAITAQWIYENGIIDQYTQGKLKEGRMAMFLLRPTQGWPHGNYRVVLYVNQREELRIPFSIK
jgi:hypothetical protein